MRSGYKYLEESILEKKFTPNKLPETADGKVSITRL